MRGSRWKGRRGRRYLNYLAVSFFSAIAVVILFNALIWQKSRHSAPLLLSRAATATAGKEPRTAEVTAVPLPRRPRPAVIPDDSPRISAEKPFTQKSPVGAVPSRAAADTSPARQTDQISELLNAAQTPPSGPSAIATMASPYRKSVLAAQRALVKLGFVLQPDGLAGTATRQAIKQYERARGLSVRGELTPALMQQLKAEAGNTDD